MKKIIIAVLVFATMFFSASCGLLGRTSNQSNTSVSSHSASVSGSISSGVNSGQTNNITEGMEVLDLDKGYSVFGGYDNRLYYLNENDHSYYSYDYETKKTTSLGTIKGEYTSSGDYLIFQNYMYHYASVGVNGEDSTTCHLYRLDLSKNDIKILSSEVQFPPFEYFYYYDKDRIGIFGPKQIVNGYEYYFKLFNVNTSQNTPVIKYDFDDTSQKGVTMSAVSIDGSDIYAYCIDKTSSETKYVIRDFNENGKIVSEIPVPEQVVKGLDKYDPTDSVFNFEKFGDYYFFGTLDYKLTFLYKYQDSKFVPIDICDDQFSPGGYMLSGVNDPILNKDIKYVYFYGTNTNSIKALDIASGKIYRLKVSLPDTAANNSYSFIDNHDNLIINVANENQKTKCYIVDEKTIEKLLT